MKKHLNEITKAIIDIDKITESDPSIRDFLLMWLNKEESKANEIIYKFEPTLIRVEFHSLTKVINSDTTKDAYVESIKELGIENVKQYFPKLIKKQPGKSLVFLAPNQYLDVGLKNPTKQRNIERIAKRLGRIVKVTLHHSTPYNSPMPSSSFSALDAV